MLNIVIIFMYECWISWIQMDDCLDVHVTEYKHIKQTMFQNWLFELKQDDHVTYLFFIHVE